MWEEGRPARDHGLKEWQDGNFSGFSFSLIYPRLGAGKAATQIQQWVQERQRYKILHILYNSHSTPAKNRGKTLSLFTPLPAKTKWGAYMSSLTRL